MLSKLEAYALQDEGEDTVDAQTRLGLPIDAREYGAAAAVLADVGVDRVRLLTGNPAKVSALRQAGFDVVESVSVATPVTSENVRYLETKGRRMGHDVMGIPEGATSGAGKDM